MKISLLHTLHRKLQFSISLIIFKRKALEYGKNKKERKLKNIIQGMGKMRVSHPQNWYKTL
jgi:hypothetical protein